MFDRWTRLALAIAAPMLLTGCLLTPGKFVSTMTIHADRTFSFTYRGEVIAVDPAEEMAQGMAEGMRGAFEDFEDEDPENEAMRHDRIAFRQDKNVPDDPAGSDRDQDVSGMAANDAKMHALAAALEKEHGYRSVVYKGDGVFEIDYAASGFLGHNFVFPFNSDAEIIIPFVTVELRGDDRVRVSAPGFAQANMAQGAPAAEAASMLDGSFTLITDAEIVSQNSEEGATGEGVMQRVAWEATPFTHTAPMAMLRMATRD